MKEIEVKRSGEVSASEGHTLVGYPIVWDQTTKVYEEGVGAFLEKVSPNAIETADLSDVVLNINHDDNQVVARTKNDSLSFEIDDYGLKMTALLRDAQFQKDTYEKVKQGLLNQMSFHALVRYEDSYTEEGELVKTVVNIGKVNDVSLVTRPAYDGTSVIARSKEGEKENMEDKKIDEKVKNEEEIEVEETAYDVAEDVKEEIKDKAEEQGIDYDKLAEKVAEKIGKQKKEGEKENMENKELQNKNLNVERSATLDVESLNTMQNASTEVKRASDEYLGVWARCIREGDKNMKEAKRFLATNGSHGESNLVPTKLEEKIITELRNGGHLANMCSSKSVRGILEYAFEKSATDANWHTEGGAALPEEEITYDKITIEPQFIKKWIMVTDRMEEMTDIEFGKWLIDEITNKILEFLDDQIIGGTGAVKGIAKNSNEMFVKHVTGLTDKDLATCGNDALAEIEVGQQPIMVINQRFYYKHLAKKTDSQGRPLATQTTLEGIVKPVWNGMIVEFSKSKELATDVNDSAKPFAVVGDFKAYELNCPSGYDVKVLEDPYTKAPENMIRYIGKLLVGGDVIVPHSFATLTMAGA